MQFFLHEIVARIVALYLCVDCYRMVRHGLVERKIQYINDDILDWLISGWSNWVVHRDATPVRYWALIGSEVMALAACLIVAIFGWFQPGT